ncbi:MAG: hypothetical protein ACRDSS_05180 [Actinocrinis sp.]
MARGLDWRAQASATLAPVEADLARSTGGDCVMMGWGILGVVSLLTPMLDTFGRRTNLRDIAGFTSGLRSGLLNASVFGSDLIAQGEGAAEPVVDAVIGDGVRPSLPSGVGEALPQVVARAQRTLREHLLVPNMAEVLFDLLASQGDFATGGAHHARSLLPVLAAELPGLDLAHAGVGQLGCGAYFYERGLQAVAADVDGRKRGRAGRREAESSAARDSGPVLVGAVMLLAGDICLAAAG